jgi:hypothetical protein
MPATLRPLPSGLPARAALFWQLQLAGWIGFSVISLPLKHTVYGSMQAALLISAYQLPLSIALTGLLRLYYRRARPAQQSFAMGAGLVLAGCALTGALDVLISIPFNGYLGYFGPGDLVSSGLFFFRTAVYVIWSLAYFLIKILLLNRAQAFRSAVAEEKLRFEILRYQLNPDFLAKSLATISHQIDANPAAARAMTAQLADFYRNTVRQSDQGRPPTIGDEVALLRAYLEIERLHQPDALRVRFEVDDSLLSQPLPPVLLLPLAEKAVRECRGTATEPLEITITAQRTPDGAILLEVANSARAGHSRAPMPMSMELDAPDVRASLERHYPGRHRFALSRDSLTIRAAVHLPLEA